MKVVLYTLLVIGLLGFVLVKGVMWAGKKAVDSISEELAKVRYVFKEGEIYFYEKTNRIEKVNKFKLEAADPPSFELLEPKNRRAGDHHIYARDIKHYYKDREILPNAIPDEFVIGENLFERFNRRKESAKRRKKRKEK